MESDLEPKSPKRAKISQEDDEVATKEGENPRIEGSDKISANSTSTDSETAPERKSTDEEVLVISSDDDSGKSGEQSPSDVAIKAGEPGDSTATTEQPSEQPEKPSDETIENKETIENEETSENIDITENKDITENMDITENKDIIENQDITEIKDITENKDITTNKDIAENKDFTEHQDTTEHKDITENQDTTENKDITEEKSTEDIKDITDEKSTEDIKDITDEKSTEEIKDITEEKSTEEIKDITEEKSTDDVTDEKSTEEIKDITEEKSTEEIKVITEEKSTEEIKDITEEKSTEEIKDITEEKSIEDTGLKDVDSNDNKPAANSPGSPDECISQEDLLAHLGLGSVRSISNTKPKKEEKVSNGVLKERLPLIPHKPKESIVDLLRAPKLKSHEEKGKTNGETPVTVVNGVSDDDDSAPGTRTPSEADDDDELLVKEQLIEELRQELRNEEAKLLLLKKIQAAQNDPKATIKYTKEKENEKVIAGVQYTGSKSGNNQLTTKKNQSLPPPPPLKTHISTSGTYQPPVAIQPKILPKVSNVQSLHLSKQSQGSKSARTGSSAIKDLQNVISSMSTSLIHPTPMYPRAGSQGGATVYTTHSQNSPVRPTPVRANNPPSGSTASSYASFPAHISSKASASTVPISTAGKQAAAKMALRKQLEKTLLQIPPPKPPPAEWSFIPNLNSAEFMMLAGFEKVVDAILEKENAKRGKSVALTEKPQTENPKVCGQCGTDFTPCWKTKNKDGADVLMCEKCSTVNVKKELKTEHTARLKAAFLKALKQEQEIEQKMSETTLIAPKPQSSSKSSSHQPSSSTSSKSHHHVSHHQGVHHGSHRHRHVQGIYHHHQQHNDSLLFQLQQQHLQQQQQEMEVAARRHGDVRWHPYHPGHHHSSHKQPAHHHNLVSESDRQYLLDMIPSQPLNYSSSRI